VQRIKEKRKCCYCSCLSTYLSNFQRKSIEYSSRNEQHQWGYFHDSTSKYQPAAVIFLRKVLTAANPTAASILNAAGSVNKGKTAASDAVTAANLLKPANDVKKCT